MERLRSSGHESKKRQKLLQTQVRTLLDEKADLLLQIQDQTREISVLRRSLGFGGQDPVDLMKKDCTGSQVTSDDLKPLLMERDCLKAKVKEMENQLKQFKPDTKNDNKTVESTPENTPEKIP